jgi:ribosomal protein S18 acetylase RimI-like enzyme
MTNALITRAAIKDVPQLVQLVNSAYRGEASKRGWTTEADLLDGIRTDTDSMQELINKPDAVILKYCSQPGELAGCVYLKKQNRQMYLGMLTVAPQLQAAGIGRQLLKAAEEHAKQQGCHSVVMSVISVRHELIAWYERHGYRKTGQVEPFPSDPRFGIPRQPLEFVVLEKVW